MFRSQAVCILAGAISALAALVTLFGWALNRPSWTDWDSNGISMLPNTAFAALLAGLALILITTRSRRWAIGLGLAVGLIGAATLFEHLTRIDLRIDLMLFSQSWGQKAVSAPGRMGPPASISFAILGAALVGLATGRRRQLAVYGGLIVVSIAVLSIIGYSFGADLLYTIPSLTAIALQTSTTLFALGIGVIVAAPEAQPMRTLLENSAAAVLVRRALPVVLLLPVVVGWLRLEGQQWGLFDVAFGTSLRTVTEMILLAGLLWWSAAAVRAHEAELQKHRERLAAELAGGIRLQEVSTRLFQVEDAGGLYADFLSAAMSILRAQRGTLHLVDADTGQFTPLAERGFSGALAEPLRQLPLLDQNLSSTLRAGGGVTIADIESAAAPLAGSARQAFRQAGLRAVQWTPLLSRAGALLGMISNYWEQPHQPADWELRLLDALARQAADLTARCRVEAELRRSEAELRRRSNQLATLLDTAAICLHRVGPDGIIQWANEAELKTLGYAREDYIGRPIADFHVDAEIIADILSRLLRGERLFEYEARLLCQDGSIKTVLIDSSVLWEDGRFIHTQCFTRDVTQRKLAESSLRQLAAELSEADQRKNEFLAMLAHELRNPLAPIRNAIQILQHSAEDVTMVRTSVDMMDRQITQLVRLVDDLLDVSRITRGKIELRPERVSLAVILQQAIETSRPALAAAQHELKLELPAEPIFLHADPVRLAQVFANLLNNASKYTDPQGTITLTATRHDHEAHVTVRDTGMGIAPEVLPKIFELFTQADRSLDRSGGGLGIGLTLVQRLVEMHHGAVAARSDGLGHGCEFTVRLPVLTEIAVAQPEVDAAPYDARVLDGASPTDALDSAAAADGVPPNGTAASANLSAHQAATVNRILVVDDNQDSANSLSMLLEMGGSETQTAFDGLAAVAAAESFRPHIVLLDIGLPLLNGYEVARKIRGEGWGQSMILVALTGWGHEDDRKKSREVGFNHHLVKPVRYRDLSQLIAELTVAPADGPLT
ncbi:MAG TPA: ATP-binding protein [Pirellulales bacterium]|nr:ATP-binding protein [Pirellulales bacterium]